MPPSVEHHGNDGTTKVLMPNHPRKRFNKDKEKELVFLWWVAQDSAEAEAPNIGDPLPPPDENLLVDFVEIFPTGTPERQFIRAIYKDPTSSGSSSTYQAGEIIQETDAALQEKPIDEHPDFVAAREAGDAAIIEKFEAEKAAGRKTFLIATVSYKRTEYLASFFFSENNITKNIGCIVKPQGLSGATDGAWLKTGINVRKAGRNTEVQETYLFDSGAWNPLFYCTTTTT